MHHQHQHNHHNHHHKRTSSQRKKRSAPPLGADDTGTGRNVHISKGWGGGCGYGFTISSQRPCILSTIIRHSPADLAGLKAGDCLKFVNGVDVAELPHDDVVRLIGQSTGRLQLRVSNRLLYSDSVSRQGEMWNADSESSDRVFSYSCRRRRGDDDDDGKERTVPRRLVLQSVGGARSYTCLKGTGIVHSLPWKSPAQLPGQLQNDSSWSSSFVEIEMPHERRVTGQEFSGYLSVQEASVGKEGWFDASREVLGCSLASACRRTKSVNGSLNRGTGLRNEKLPSRLSQILQNECCGEEFVDCAQTLTVTDPNSRRHAVDSNRHTAVPEVSWNQGDRLSTSLQTATAAITTAVVGYIGSIQLPDTLNSCSNNSSSSHLQQVRSCVRRLRKMQKMHAVVLMEVSVLGVKVTSGSGSTVAFYPAREVVHASVCPDHRQFFGILTASSGHGTEAAEAQAVTPCCPLSACHVFMVEAFMACHGRHVHRAQTFDLHCRPRPDTQLCDQFPRDPDHLVLSVTRLCTDRPPRRNPQSRVYLGLEDHPQRGDSSSNSSSSSSSDSGLSVGQGDACEYEVHVPGITPEVVYHSCTRDGESDRSRIFTNKPSKEHQHQPTTSPMCLSPQLDSPERFLSCTPGSPQYLSRSPLFPECPYNTPNSLSPLSSSLEYLTPATPTEHRHLQASLNTAFLPDSPADSKYFSTSSTNPHILSFAAGQEVQTLSSDKLSHVDVLSGHEHAQTELTQAGSLQVRAGVSRRLADSFPHLDPLCEEDCLPCADTSRDCTQQKIPPVLLSGLEVQHQNTQQDWSEKLHKNSQERVKAWMQEESRSGIAEAELHGAESTKDAGLLPEAATSHQRPASGPVLPDNLSGDRPSGLPDRQTLQPQGDRVSQGSQGQRTGAGASEDRQAGRVSGWAVSFPTLLADPIGLRLFTEYLRTEHSEENIHFWNDVETFKRLSDPETRKSKGLEIYNAYLSEEASDPVNVDSDARALSLCSVDTDISVHVFDIAQKQVYHLMRMDCYGRFLNSDLYKSHLRREKEGHKLQEIQTFDPTVSEGSVKSSQKKRRRSFLRWKYNRKSVSEDTMRKTKREKRRKQDRNYDNEEEEEKEEEEEEECGFATIQATEMEEATDYKNLFPALDHQGGIPHVFSKRSGSSWRNLLTKLCTRQQFSEQCSPHISFSAS